MFTSLSLRIWTIEARTLAGDQAVGRSFGRLIGQSDVSVHKITGIFRPKKLCSTLCLLWLLTNSLLIVAIQHYKLSGFDCALSVVFAGMGTNTPFRPGFGFLINILRNTISSQMIELHLSWSTECSISTVNFSQQMVDLRHIIYLAYSNDAH